MTRPSDEARSRLLESWDRRYLWHPFTPQEEWSASTPLLMDRAEGNWLVDTRGRRYLDGVSSLWVNVHGHRHPALDRAVRRQIDRMAHSTFLGLSHPPAVELARALVGVAPRGLTRVFYSDNGSTAVEVALKMAFQYWAQRGEPRRRRFVSFRNAYHGDTLGSVGVGGIDPFHRIYRPLVRPSLKAPSPYCYRCELKLRYPACRLACAEALAPLLEKHRGEVAAVIVEPLVQAAAGMVTSPPGYLARIERIARSAGVLLIADEVATGFGRTGRMFAVEAEGVRPDLLAVAKGLTGGYLPVAATLATEKIYRAFLAPPALHRTLYHGHTYTANPLGCAAALENLALFRREKTLRRVRSRSALLGRLLRPLADHPRVGEIRQRGLMVGIELVADRRTRRAFPEDRRMGHRVALEARRHGVVLRPLGDVIVLMPPLSVTPAELSLLVEAARRSIDAVAGRGA